MVDIPTTLDIDENKITPEVFNTLEEFYTAVSDTVGDMSTIRSLSNSIHTISDGISSVYNKTQDSADLLNETKLGLSGDIHVGGSITINGDKDTEGTDITIPGRLYAKCLKIQWETLTDYLQGNIITFNGFLFRAKQSHTSTADFYEDLRDGYWERLAKSEYTNIILPDVLDVSGVIGIDSYFDSGTGSDNSVSTIAVLSDGKILIGGSFTSFNGSPCYGIARLTRSGSLDNTFSVALDDGDVINTIALLPSGNLLVAGTFDDIDNYPLPGIALLTSSGSCDTSYDLSSYITGGVNDIALLSDSSAIVVGSFNATINESTTKGIIHVISGTVDSNFNVEDEILGEGPDNTVLTVDTQVDDKIIIGGEFITYNGTSCTRIARLYSNGLLDTDFDQGTGFNGSVKVIKIQPNRKILVGGAFTTYQGDSVSYLTRLNVDGSVDNTFNPGTGPNGAVATIDVQEDGSIVIGGEFTSYNGTSRSRIARINSDGSLDTLYDPGTGFDNTVSKVKIQPDGKIIAGGAFTSYNQQNFNYIVRIDGNVLYDVLSLDQEPALRNIGIVVKRGDLEINNPKVQYGYHASSIGMVRSLIDHIRDENNLPLAPNTWYYINKDDESPTLGVMKSKITTENFMNARRVLLTLGQAADGSVPSGIIMGHEKPQPQVTIFTETLGDPDRITDSTYEYDLEATPINAECCILSINGKQQVPSSYSIAGSILSIPNTNYDYINGDLLVGGVAVNNRGSLHPCYYSNTGATAFKMIEQSDGNIVFVGSFTSYSGVTRNRIVRTNSYGIIDPMFFHTTGANNSIQDIAVQDDGKLIIVGEFTQYNGVTRSYIARVCTDGKLDTTFNVTGVNAKVWAVSIQEDGKILIGGDFTSCSGVSRSHIARLSSSGILDTSFTPETGPDDTVKEITVQSDGKILIGGDFTAYSGTSRNRVARITTSGTLDTSFDPGTGIGDGESASVYAIAVQEDGMILIGGYFFKYNNNTRKGVVRVTSTGTLDASSDLGAGVTNSGGTTGTVMSISIQEDGKILLGGVFDYYNGTARPGFARVDTDGSIDAGFTPDNTSEPAYVIQTSDGGFVLSNSTKLTSDGSVDTTFNPPIGANGTIRTILPQDDGNVILGGEFTTYAGISANRIVRKTPTGLIDTTFNSGTGANDYVLGSALQSDGKIIICGEFTTYNSTARHRIARLTTSGTLDESFVDTTIDNSNLYDVVIQADGKMIAVGEFGTIRRYNADGTQDVSFTVGVSGLVNNYAYTAALQNDNKIIVGGTFTLCQGTASNYIVRLSTDGSVDTSFAPSTGANGTINDVIIQPDGKILIAGQFTTFNGVSRTRIARVNTDGSLDTSFNPGTGANGTISNMLLQDDGKIVIAGSFTTYNGISRSYIARINSVGTLDATFIPPVSSNGTAIAFQKPINTIWYQHSILRRVAADYNITVGAGSAEGKTVFDTGLIEAPANKGAVLVGKLPSGGSLSILHEDEYEVRGTDVILSTPASATDTILTRAFAPQRLASPYMRGSITSDRLYNSPGYTHALGKDIAVNGDLTVTGGSTYADQIANENGVQILSTKIQAGVVSLDVPYKFKADINSQSTDSNIKLQETLANVVFKNSSCSYIKAVALDSLRSLIVYTRAGIARSIVASVESNQTVSFGTEVTLEASSTGDSYLDVVAINPSKVLVVYTSLLSGNKARAVILTIAALTITVCSPVTFSVNAARNTIISSASSDGAYFVAAYEDTLNNPASLVARVLIVSTNTITMGDPITVEDDSSPTIRYPSIARVSDTKSILTWVVTGNSKSCVLTRSSNTVLSAGSALSVAVGTVTNTSTLVYSDKRAIILARVSGTIHGYICSVGSTSLTKLGSTATTSCDVTDTGLNAILACGDIGIVCLPGASTSKLVTFRLSEETFNSGSAYITFDSSYSYPLSHSVSTYCSMLMLNQDNMVLCFNDSSNTNQGTLSVINLLYSPLTSDERRYFHGRLSTYGSGLVSGSSYYYDSNTGISRRNPGIVSPLVNPVIPSKTFGLYRTHAGVAVSGSSLFRRN